MMYGSGPGAAVGWTWVVGAVVLVAVVVWLVLRVIARSPAADSAAPILSARFARGEIDAEAYARMRAVLGRPERRLGGGRLAIAVVVGFVVIAVLALGVLLVSGDRSWSGSIGGGIAPGPGAPGFVAGTPSAPRVVRIVASGQLRFIPDVVTVQAGETITFEVTSMGMTVHEFMVGPATDVAADTPGTPEVADIGMMATKALTYTFNGPGPFAFACHAPGHFEAGMKGTITIQP
jgi:uncharacterized cupredoxin-like copper-binding protein